MYFCVLLLGPTPIGDHHLNIKISVFSFMFLRALCIVSLEILDKEIEFIRKIGPDLGYSLHILDICHDEANRKFYREDHKIKSVSKNSFCLPYFVGFENVRSLLKSFNVNLIFSCNYFKGLADKKTAKQNCNIIYNIPCMDYDSFYIGQTSKELSFRINQNKYCVRMGQISSGLFVHLSTFY